MHRSGRLRRAVALLALTASVAACTGGGNKNTAKSTAPAASPSASSSESTSAGTQSAAPVPQATSTQAAAASVSAAPTLAAAASQSPTTSASETSSDLPTPTPSASENVLAQFDFQRSTEDWHVDIIELKQTAPELMTLSWRATFNGPGKTPTFNAAYIFSDGFGSANGVYLVDEIGKKKYLVVTDTTGRCLCSSGRGDKLTIGRSEVIFATFPAPPAAVKKMSVHFLVTPPLRNVPVSR